MAADHRDVTVAIKPAADLNASPTALDLARLPVFSQPTTDVKGGNHISKAYVAVYENGIEVTVEFADEDRPHPCQDAFYDCIRRPCFGRTSDIESFFITSGEGAVVEFPGTYAGDAKWDAQLPAHLDATVSADKFSTHKTTDGKSHIVVHVNTWSHLFGEATTNPGMPHIKYVPTFEGSSTSPEAMLRDGEVSVASYRVYQGSRVEVDAQYKGCMTSLKEVKCSKPLGERIG